MTLIINSNTRKVFTVSVSWYTSYTHTHSCSPVLANSCWAAHRRERGSSRGGRDAEERGGCGFVNGRCSQLVFLERGSACSCVSTGNGEERERKTIRPV